MTLRSRYKPLPPLVPDVDEEEEKASNVVSSSSADSIRLTTSHITTAPSPNVFDSNTLHREQTQDPDIQRILGQLNNTLTVQSTLSSSFIIKNNLLHKLISPHPHSTQKTAVPYLPSSMVQPLLIAMHDDPYQGGHFSTDKMVSKISCRYWWPQMRATIHRHVQACVPCQRYNHSRQKKPGHLHPIPPTAIPFSVIGMDFCGPFVASPHDNKYVLVVTDLFTRLSQLFLCLTILPNSSR